MKQNTTTRRVVDEIKQRIRSGRLVPGDRVPSARELVRDHGIAIATASKVLAQLRREGLVRPQRGVGTIVRGGGERGHEPTREQVVRSAIAIADEEGLEGLSLRRVGVELAVTTVTVQRLVGTPEELVLAMADAVLGDAAVSLPRAGPWRAMVESIARTQWVGYRDHAWLVGTLSMTRPQLIPNGMRHTEALLTALEQLRLGPATTLRTGVMIIAYVRGMAVGLEPERRAEQDTGLASDAWVQSRESLFAEHVPNFPTLGRLARAEGVDMSLDALFERGLALLLDGLEAGVGPRRRRNDRPRPRRA